MRGLEDLGRVRLSRSFFLRDFLHSEIAELNGIANVPDDPDLAIANGKRFCETCLEPLVETFGVVSIRSGYRSADLNRFGNEHHLNCARNDNPSECHIWDRAGAEGAVAGATVVVPWFADRYAQGRDWRDLAWWVHDHVDYSALWFFPKLAAFNIDWRPCPWKQIGSYIPPKGHLLRRGAEPDEARNGRRRRYADFPPFRGLADVLPR